MVYLFRGTTDGFPGNEVSRLIPATCTSENPFIAYLFAKQGRKLGGEPVILVFEKSKFEGRLEEPNGRYKSESEVVLAIAPLKAFEECKFIVTLNNFEQIIRNLEINPDEYALNEVSGIFMKKRVNHSLINKIIGEIKNV